MLSAAFLESYAAAIAEYELRHYSYGQRMVGALFGHRASPWVEGVTEMSPHLL